MFYFFSPDFRLTSQSMTVTGMMCVGLSLSFPSPNITQVGILIVLGNLSSILAFALGDHSLYWNCWLENVNTFTIIRLVIEKSHSHILQVSILTVPLLTYSILPSSSPGEPYSQSLAKGLILVFFFITASILGTPWRQIRQAWRSAAL